MSTLSAAAQNAHMRRERSTLQQLCAAATRHDFPTLRALVEDYIRQEQGTVVEVLSQFKDAQKRTVLHFGCLCPIIKKEEGEEDIVEQIMEWIFVLPASLPQQQHRTQQSIATLLRSKDSAGLTPLMLAAQLGSARRVHALIAADERCQNPSTSISSNGSSEKKSTLGLARSKAGATALHYAAAAACDAATIDRLLAAGRVARDTYSNSGGTPLHWACGAAASSCTAQRTTIQALLDRGADIHAQREGIPPPLFLALAAGNDGLALFLLQQPQQNLRPSLEYVLQPGNVTALHMAADLNLVETLARLIEYYCQDAPSSEFLERVNEEGYTALDLAAKEKHIECVRRLLHAGNTAAAATSEEDALAFVAQWKKAPNACPEVKPPTPPIDNDAGSNNHEAGNHDATEQQAKHDASQILSERSPESGTMDATEAEHTAPAQAHKSMGNQYFSQGQWEPAVDEYTRAILLQPYEATFYSNRSAAYMMGQQYEKALYDAVLAQTLLPTWPKAFFRVAVARLALRRFEDAAVAAWEGLQLDPENVELKELLQKCVQKGRQDYHKKK